MENEKIIDLTVYRNRLPEAERAESKALSEELQTAIQNLIHRLRELGPIV